MQLPPAATTTPDAQVPPVMENAPAVVPTGVIPGLAVNVNGPAVAPAAVLLTVIVPFFGVVSAVIVVNAGVGPAKAIVAPSTVNVTALLAPVGVETVTAWAPSVAVDAMRQFAVSVVAVVVPVIVQATPVPPFTAVATVRLVPVRVTGTVVPRTPLVGLIEISPAPVAVPVNADVCVPVCASGA